MKLRITILIITILSFLFMISCNEEKPVEPDPTPSEVIIPETTKPINQADFNNYFVSFSNDSSKITFNNEANNKYNFNVNDVIVIENEEGILSKITGIETSGNQIILTIEDASVTEAIEKGNGTFSRILTTNMIEKIPEGSGISISNLNKGNDINSIVLDIDQILYDHDNNLNTTGDQIKVTGTLELGPTINGEFVIEDFQLKKIDVNYQITESVGITGSIGILNLSVPVVEYEFPPINFSPIIVIVGTVPVIITPQLVIKTGVDLQINSEATISIEQSMNYTAGLKYENGDWSAYKEIDTSFTYNPPSVSLEFGAKAYVTPELKMKIYGTVSPYLSADLFGRLSVTPYQNPNWKLYAGLEVGGGVKMKIWKKTLFDYSFTFFNFELLIAQASNGTNTAPTAFFTVDPQSGTTNITFNFDASGCSDLEDPPSSLQVRWDWEGDGTWDTPYSTTKTATHQYSSQGQYTANLQVKDTGGLTDEHAKTITVTTGGGTTNGLRSVSFISPITGWTSGVSGTILNTTDGGGNWITQSSGTTSELSSIFFISATTGWAAGIGGIIRNTTNGGSNWVEQSSGTTQWLASVYFVSPTTGWIIGHGGTILKTDNGGSNWTLQNSGTGNKLNSGFFVSTNIGWAVGDGGTIRATTNGGTSWFAQASGTTAYLFSVKFVSSSIGWAVGDTGVIIKTADGGNNWNPQNSGTNARLNSVYFADDNYGWVVGTNGTIHKTTNGGSSWVSQSSGTTNSLQSVYFISSTTGWIVGEDGIILYTTDGGNNWIEQ